MMVVVPTFSASEQADDPIVAAVIGRRIIPIAPHVRHRIHDHVVCQTTTVRSAPPQVNRLAPKRDAWDRSLPIARAARKPAAKKTSQHESATLIQFLSF